MLHLTYRHWAHRPRPAFQLQRRAVGPLDRHADIAPCRRVLQRNPEEPRNGRIVQRTCERTRFARRSPCRHRHWWESPNSRRNGQRGRFRQADVPLGEGAEAFEIKDTTSKQCWDSLSRPMGFSGLPSISTRPVRPLRSTRSSAGASGAGPS